MYIEDNLHTIENCVQSQWNMHLICSLTEGIGGFTVHMQVLFRPFLRKQMMACIATFSGLISDPLYCSEPTIVMGI